MAEHEPYVLRRILALRQFALFASAELGDLALLADNLVEQTYPRGAMIAPGGARPPAVHLVIEGEIAVDAARRRVWGPRQVFGALEVLARRELPAPAVAACLTRTLQLSSAEVNEVLDESFGVMRAMLRELATRVAAGRFAAPAAIAVPDTEPFGFVDRLIVLRQLPWLARARLDAVAMLANASDEIRIPAGRPLVRAGDLATSAYVVLAGELQTSDGPTLGAGEAFGSLEVLADLPYPIGVDTVTPTRLLETRASALLDAIEDQSDLGLALIRSFANQLADRSVS